MNLHLSTVLGASLTVQVRGAEQAALNELRVTPVDLHSDPKGRRSYSHFMRGKTEAQAG